MEKINVLILTDHSNHSKENALYAFAKSMWKHEATGEVAVASRGLEANKALFEGALATTIEATIVTNNFAFEPNGAAFTVAPVTCQLADYDLIWLRLPPPISADLAAHLEQLFSNQVLVNHPQGIRLTGSKEFLLKFPELCPPMRLCETIEEIEAFKANFPIVLKPLRAYGGAGIVRIEGEQVWEGHQEYTWEVFKAKFEQDPILYLGVKFLKNVSQGDKRVVVVNGQIMGASLRMPKQDSWICNVAMGGSSTPAIVSLEEEEIVRQVNPVLLEQGIVMYGIDTLVDDSGQRILSELNTTSIGGLPQIAAMEKKPLVEQAIDLIIQYYYKKQTRQK